MLIVSSDTDTSSGLYISLDNGVTWSAKIVPPNASGAGEGVTYISGFNVDAGYDIYISWYGIGTPSSAKNPQAYSVESLIAGSCNQSVANNAAAVALGGVSVGKIYIPYSGTTASVKFYDKAYFGTADFFSNSVLGVSLLLDKYKICQRVYVPSLGPHCDTGGYSIGTLCPNCYN